jgi:hypothetical protein
MTLNFASPASTYDDGVHHGDAAAGNIEATSQAIKVLDDILDGKRDLQRVLLKAAAGAGKSYALKRMVAHALRHPACSRVAVVAFTNKQVFPLAEALGNLLGKKRVCLLVARDRYPEVPPSASAAATVVTEIKAIPDATQVVVATSHKIGGWALTWLRQHLGNAKNGNQIFDVMFVDESWQLPLHRYREIETLAPIAVGAGDVGQLPPLDPGQNPWRGDRGYNPYRAWPTYFESDRKTWSIELPAVWRPTSAQLPLWRSFYLDWEKLHCVAASGDRSVSVTGLRGDAARLWKQVATGVPSLIEIDGLPDPEAADVDLPLLHTIERWLDQLLAKGLTVHTRHYDDTGLPADEITVHSDRPGEDPLIAVLATRNQAVDDAADMVDRLVTKHGLPEGAITSSTVDSWQGQTNSITLAIHPLSGASQLDEFNSAFGRLAVTCTRATHGLLMVSRAGLTELLAAAPARPGTPIGEPGTRQLPRQTHQRILETFSRATLSA